MPELPEVETVRNYLQKNIINWKVKEIKLSNKKSLRNIKEKELDNLIKQKVVSCERYAKHLIIRFSKNYLILHLRMEGKFFVFKDYKEMEEYTNRFHDVLIIEFNEGILLFQDTRRFATIDMFDNKINIKENEIISKIGKEPFELSEEELFKSLSKKTIAIKSALLDQKIISGIGNIYADEILFTSKIIPTRKSNLITYDEVRNIIENSRKILSEAIKMNGTTIKSYTSSLGVEGNYQNKLKVHQRNGELCMRDNTPIVKIKINGRGTYYCPTCQK